jgi:hypothetical protein
MDYNLSSWIGAGYRARRRGVPPARGERESRAASDGRPLAERNSMAVADGIVELGTAALDAGKKRMESFYRP